MIALAVIAIAIISYTLYKQIRNITGTKDLNGLNNIRYIMVVGLLLLLGITLCIIFNQRKIGYALCLIQSLNWALLYLDGDWRTFMKLPVVFFKWILKLFKRKTHNT